PGLPEGDELVLWVPDRPDGRLARRRNHPRLARGQAEGRLGALLGHQLHAGPGGAGHLGARARLQLDRVHHGAPGDVAQGQSVPGPDLRIGAGYQRVALRDALGCQDVSLLAVRVVEQRQPRTPVRVVLDVRDLRRHAVLVPAEVDDPVAPRPSAALLAGR